ncbi:hypothetical protein B0H13DRAFT_1889697 [Mycena leptocephala]|nr:hypothetical protein B0H13DRAFT_1889697 [Mycena leptocephala]
MALSKTSCWPRLPLAFTTFHPAIICRRTVKSYPRVEDLRKVVNVGPLQHGTNWTITAKLMDLHFGSLALSPLTFATHIIATVRVSHLRLSTTTAGAPRPLPRNGTVAHTAEPFPSGIPMQEHRCVLEAFENPETPNRPARTAREVREKHTDGARTPIAPESEELQVEPLGLPLFLMHSSVVNGVEIPSLIASVTQGIRLTPSVSRQPRTRRLSSCLACLHARP